MYSCTNAAIYSYTYQNLAPLESHGRQPLTYMLLPHSL
jgi:hypothetical protein